MPQKVPGQGVSLTLVPTGQGEAAIVDPRGAVSYAGLGTADTGRVEPEDDRRTG